VKYRRRMIAIGVWHGCNNGIYTRLFDGCWKVNYSICMLFKWIESFVIVADHMNFSSAAETLYITQPALSKQIKALEAHLGVKLFHRFKGNRLALTEAGETFLPEARDLLNHTASAINHTKEMTASLAGVSGTLKIAIDSKMSFSDLNHAALPSIINVMKEDYPRVTIELSFNTMQENLRNTKDGIIDIGIFITDENYSGTKQLSSLNMKVLAEDVFVILVPTSLAHLDLNEEEDREVLRTLPSLVIRNEGADHITGRFHILSRYGIIPNLLYCESPAETRLRLAIGDGYAILPKNAAQADVDAGLLGMLNFDKDDKINRTEIIACWKKENPNPLVETFTGIFDRNFSE